MVDGNDDTFEDAFGTQQVQRGTTLSAMYHIKMKNSIGYRSAHRLKFEETADLEIE